MKAVTLPRHGGRDALTYVTDFPAPVPGEGEVLVKVAATGTNQIDLVVTRGYPGIEIPLPHVPGGDVVGTVEALGPKARSVLVGTRVVAHPLVACGKCPLCREGKPNLCLKWQYVGLHRKGSYAEYAVVPAENVLPLPRDISFEQAVALPVAGLTAYHALKTVGDLQAGQTFFTWGGAGGLGMMAVQIATYLGATVIATVGSDEKAKALTSLGVEHVINRKQEDVREEVRKIAPAGVDLVLDYVGPETFPTSFDMLKKGGQMLLCGIITGRETTLSIHMTYLKHVSIRGLYLGTMTELQDLAALVAGGQVRPLIGHTFALSEAAQALELMAEGKSVGKTVLKVS